MSNFILKDVESCVRMLIESSLNSDAKWIVIIINRKTCNIRVEDDGEVNLKNDLSPLEIARCKIWRKYDSFNDEDVYNLVGACRRFAITCKVRGENQLCMVIDDDKKTIFEVSNSKSMPADGRTSVILEDLFHVNPLQRELITSYSVLEDVIQYLKAISIYYRNVQLALKDEQNDKILFLNKPAPSFLLAFLNVIPPIGDCFEDHPHRASIVSSTIGGRYSVTGIISRKTYINDRFQFCYINKKFVSATTHGILYRLINQFLSSTDFYFENNNLFIDKYSHPVLMQPAKYPMFAIDFVLPNYDSISYNNVDLIECINEMVKKFCNEMKRKEENQERFSRTQRLQQNPHPQRQFSRRPQEQQQPPWTPEKQLRFRLPKQRCRRQPHHEPQQRPKGGRKPTDEGRKSGKTSESVSDCNSDIRSNVKIQIEDNHSKQAKHIADIKIYRNNSAGNSNVDLDDRSSEQMMNSRNMSTMKAVNSVVKDTTDHQNEASDALNCVWKNGYVLIDIKDEHIGRIQFVEHINKMFLIGYIKINKNNIKVALDQHAVHERIRLELLMKGYRDPDGHWFRRTLNSPKTIVMNISDIETLLKFQEKILHFGLSFKTPRPQRAQSRYGSIDVVTIPTCLYKRFYRQEDPMDELIVNCLMEIADYIKTNNCHKSFIPLAYQTVINSEACAGACKFGDELSRDDCIRLINELSLCRNPRFCAHGRPTIVPIGQISELQKSCSDHYSRW